MIRDAGLREKRRIRTPDATILAVAILHKAHVLHSLDDGMLSLNGSTIVDGLSITRPFPLSGPTLFSQPAS